MPSSFEKIAADVFVVEKQLYLSITCLHSNWPSIFPITLKDPLQIIKIFRKFFPQYGFCKTLYSDKSPLLTSQYLDEFLHFCSVLHVYTTYLTLSPSKARPQDRLIDFLFAKVGNRIVQHKQTEDRTIGVSPNTDLSMLSVFT